MRRGESNDKAEQTTSVKELDEVGPPLAKRRKDDKESEYDGKLEDCEYENDKDIIKKEWAKSKLKLSILKNLMDSTFKRRRSWISQSYPSATIVLDNFPCLRSGKIVSLIIDLLISL